MSGSRFALLALLLALPHTLIGQSPQQGPPFSGAGFTGNAARPCSVGAIPADRNTRVAKEPTNAGGASSVLVDSNSIRPQVQLSSTAAGGDAIRTRNDSIAVSSDSTAPPTNTDNGCEELNASQNGLGGLGQTQRIETVAANGLNLVGLTSYVVSKNGIAELKVAEVRNSRNGGVSGTLRLVLYFTLQPPVFGQTINGYQTATYTLGQLQGGFSFLNVDSGTIPWSSPPDGTYYVTMTLFEFSNGQYVYQDFLTFSGTFTIGLSLRGNVSYAISSGTAELKVDEVRNSRSGLSGTLRLVLYFTDQPPIFGQTINGYPTAIYTLGQLAGGFSFFNVDSGTIPWSRPPDGTYYVTMTLDEFSGGDYHYQDFRTFNGTVTVGGGSPPTADFTFSPSSPQAGQAVSFTDTSTGSPTSWSWNFGDGGTSTQQNPIHTFGQQGTYSVTLTATNANGSNAISKSVRVGAAGIAPVANFTFSPSSPATGQAVNFTDTSTGSPTSWSWNFSDGGTSTQQNPTHTFAQQGTYSVILTATNANGSNAISKSVQVGAGGGAVQITEFAVPGGNPGDITLGDDGAFWFTEGNANRIGRITYAGAITEFTDPTANSGLGGIIFGAYGDFWFTEGNANRIGRITTGGAFYPEFNVPTANSGPHYIANGPDGALWFTENNRNKIGRVTTDGAFSEFTVPTAGGQPWGITAGGDGAVWFTEASFSGNKIGRISTTGVFTEFNVPTANSGLRGIVAGPDGALWFAELFGNKIGRITTTGVFSEFNVPTASSQPNGITSDWDHGALWFTELAGNKIGRITTAGVFTEFNVPTAGSQPWSITLGPDDALWFTELAGNKIGRLVPDAPSTPLRFVPVAPCRVVDTRLPNGSYGGPNLAAGVARSFDLSKGPCAGIPPGVEAYSVNITVTGPQSFGYVTAFPQGTSQPLVSTLNYGQGQTVANAAIVPAGAGSGVTVFSYAATDLIIDINGYFALRGTLGFVPVAPCRVVDTRTANGSYGGPNLAAGVARSFDLSQGPCAGIPAGVGAYSVNVTVTDPQSFGYVTAFPQGTSQPLVSTLNYGQGQTVANAAIVPAGAGSGVTLFSYAATDLIIDINGYFAPGGGLGFVPVTPCRMVDTRRPNGPYGGPNLAAGVVRSFDLSNGPCAGIPAGVGAYSLNATVTEAQSFGFLTLFPQGGSQPLVSTLNYGQGQTLANAAIVPAGTGGISVFSFAGTHVIFDIAGYFKPF
jgi:virginiamycin B lyase